MIGVGIVRIIEDTNSLFSVYNEESGISEFEHIFDEWTNPQATYEFFKTHQNDLRNHTIDEAVDRTFEDACALEDRFYEIAFNEQEQLQTLFKPLFNNQYRLTEFQRSKAYGEFKKSWLRIYGIRIEVDKYIVTGGAIKLTQTMQDRLHTQEQLNRLTQMRDYLLQNGFNDRQIEYLEV